MSPNTEGPVKRPDAARTHDRETRSLALQNRSSPSYRQCRNAALDEAVWQKWVDKNKQRDASHRKKVIRLLGFIFMSILICDVVWWLSVSK
jgi:hypothetical protein